MTLQARRQTRLQAVRCRCRACGAHCRAWQGRSTLGGRCGTCGSYDITPVGSRAESGHAASIMVQLEAQEPPPVIRAAVPPGGDAAAIVRALVDDAPSALVVALVDRPSLAQAAAALAAGARVVADSSVNAADLDALVASAATGGPVVQLTPDAGLANAERLRERLHDGAVQRLTSARLQLGLAALDAPSRRAERLAGVEIELTEAAAELVQLARELDLLAGPRG